VAAVSTRSSRSLAAFAGSGEPANTPPERQGHRAEKTCRGIGRDFSGAAVAALLFGNLSIKVESVVWRGRVWLGGTGWCGACWRSAGWRGAGWRCRDLILLSTVSAGQLLPCLVVRCRQAGLARSAAKANGHVPSSPGLPPLSQQSFQLARRAGSSCMFGGVFSGWAYSAPGSSLKPIGSASPNIWFCSSPSSSTTSSTI
jgi:hypothetical protein